MKSEKPATQPRSKQSTLYLSQICQIC